MLVCLIGHQLRRLLTQRGLADGLAGRGRHLSHSKVPTTHLAKPHSDRHLAQVVAPSIAQALRGVD